MTQFFRRIMGPLLAGRAVSDTRPDAGSDLAPGLRNRRRARRLQTPALDTPLDASVLDRVEL